MLYIESRHKKLPEFEYITKIIFKDWLSINIQHIKSDSEQIRIYDNDKNEFFLSSKFFQDYDFENYNDSFLSFISNLSAKPLNSSCVRGLLVFMFF